MQLIYINCSDCAIILYTYEHVVSASNACSYIFSVRAERATTGNIICMDKTMTRLKYSFY